MNSVISHSIIAEAARDYDIEFNIVERMYMQSESTTVFYEKLESYIKNRAGTGIEIHSIHCPAYTTPALIKRNHVPGNCNCKK